MSFCLRLSWWLFWFVLFCDTLTACVSWFCCWLMFGLLDGFVLHLLFLGCLLERCLVVLFLCLLGCNCVWFVSLLCWCLGLGSDYCLFVDVCCLVLICFCLLLCLIWRGRWFAGVCLGCWIVYLLVGLGWFVYFLGSGVNSVDILFCCLFLLYLCFGVYVLYLFCSLFVCLFWVNCRVVCCFTLVWFGLIV